MPVYRLAAKHRLFRRRVLKMVAAFDSLSEAERDCLRLVHRGFASKEIADIRGIRPDSVDKIILSARRKIGNLRRQELARLLVEHEESTANVTEDGERGPRRAPGTFEEDHPQSLGAQPLGLGTDPIDAAQEAFFNASTARVVGTELHTPEPEDSPPEASRPFLATPLRFASDGSQENDLGPLHTIAIIAILVTAVIAAAGAAVSLLFALNQLTGR